MENLHSICWMPLPEASHIVRTHIFSLTCVRLNPSPGSDAVTRPTHRDRLPPAHSVPLHSQRSVLSGLRCCRGLFSNICLLLRACLGLRGVFSTLFRWEEPRQSGSGRPVSALAGEAEEGGPDEGTAAGEGGPHVQGHQGKVHTLRETD